MRRVIVFDVNETLLDVRALTPHFERVFGDAGALSQWFGQLLQTAFVVTLSGRYHDFGACGRHALEIVAQRRGVALAQEEIAAVADAIRSLPPHPEVRESLARLRDAGFRLATLTNSAPDALQQQMQNAGLVGYFERLLSVEAVRKFKPAPETYQMAAAELRVPIAQMRLVAAHNWDVDGAMRAGAAAAFVARPGMVLGSLDERPDIVGADLAQVVDEILARDGS